MSKGDSSISCGLQRVSLYAALAVALACAAVTAWLGVAIVKSDRVNVRGVEPFFVHTIQRMLSGQPLYQPTGTFPFETTQYPPLYYYVCAVTARLAGAGPGDVRATTAIARGLSFCFHAGQIALAFLLLVRVLKAGRLIAVLASGTLLVYVAPWQFLARPDALAAFLLTASMYCALVNLTAEAKSRKGIAALILACVFGVLATLTKQNAAVGPIVLVSFFLLTRDWRRFGIAFAACAVASLVAAGGLYAHYGAPLLENLFEGAARSGVDVTAAFENAYSVAFLTMNLSVVVAASLAAVAHWLRRGSKPSDQYLGCALMLMPAFATLAALKFGSAQNYYNDYIAVAVISLAYFFFGGTVLRKADSPRLAVAVFLMLFLPSLTIQNVSAYRSAEDRIADRAPMIAYLRPKLAAHPECVLLSRDFTLASAFPNRSVVLQSNRPPVAEPTSETTNFAGLKDLIASGHARYYAATEYHRPSIVLGQLGVQSDNFVLLKRAYGFEVWVNSKDERLRNGGFEQWNGGMPEDWRSDAAIAKSGEAFQGAAALAMPEGDWANVQQRIKVDPGMSGATVIVSACVKASARDQILLKVILDGTPNAPTWQAAQVEPGAWRKISLACELPPSVGRGSSLCVQLLRRPGAAGPLLVDDVSVAIEP